MNVTSLLVTVVLACVWLGVASAHPRSGKQLVTDPVPISDPLPTDPIGGEGIGPPTISSLPVLTIPYGDAATRMHLEREFPIDNEAFDFIIVGSTQAGSVLANRLSEIPDYNVLLLEAGGVTDEMDDAPRFAHMASTGEHNDAIYTTPSQNACLGMIKGQCKLVMGKGAGGSSSIDAMIYTRGNKDDYERWEHMVEDETWGFDGVLPCFKKSENASGVVEHKDRYFRGKKGPLRVGNLPYQSPIRDIFLKSAEQLGIRGGDYNGYSQHGASPLQAMIHNGQRYGSYHAYLEPIILNRRNLKVLTRAEILKVVIDKQTMRATGVEFMHYGTKYTALSTKEVILSAGTFGSAKLLMLSGIGPKHDLEALNIDVVLDLPVGNTLYDQVSFQGVNVALERSTLAADFLAPLNPLDTCDYRSGKGKLTLPFGLESILFANTQTNRLTNAPNVAILQNAGSDQLFFEDSTNQNLYNFITGSNGFRYNQQDIHNKYIFEMIVNLLHPKSSGFLKLRSANPLDQPIVEPNYLSAEEDVTHLFKGIQLAKQLLGMPIMQQHGAQLVPFSPPGCATLRFDTEEFWRCAIRSIAVPARSFSGTNRMGTKRDPKAVTKRNFKVRGMHNLRVIDNSVIPVTISGPNSAVSYMLGEKGAAFIKEKYLNPPVPLAPPTGGGFGKLK